MARSKENIERLSVAKLNWVRAAVLGANDGIVSVSAIILGVAGATNNRAAIFTAGLAGLVAGALSMAVGEYVSVSSQLDTEEVYINREKYRLEHNKEEEFEELVETYQKKGLSRATAHQVVTELTAGDAVKAHLDAELHLDESDLNSPMQASIASLLSFTAGAIIPLVSATVASSAWRFLITFLAVLLALIFTGFTSAHINGTPKTRAIIRNVLGGALAMIVTFGIGHLFGTAIR